MSTSRLFLRACDNLRAALGAQLGSLLDTLVATRTCPACHSRALRHLPVRVGKAVVKNGLPRNNWLVGCRSCGLVFTTRRPSKAAVDKYYAPQGRWAETRRRKLLVSTSEVANEVFDVVADAAGLRQPAAGARALDIGCGDGAWLNSLKRYGWETFGFEPCTRVAFERHHEITTIPADHRFDLVILSHVLEHLAEPGAMIHAAAAALRPGGWLLIGVPSLDGLPVHGDFRYCINAMYHLQAFTESCLRVLLNSAGFVEIVRVADPPAFQQTRRHGKQLRIVARLALASSDITAVHSDPLEAARHALQAAGVLARAAS